MRKRKKIALGGLLCVIALLLTEGRGYAYVFSSVAQTGQTLYFDTVGGVAVVVRPSSNVLPTQGWLGHQKPTGVLRVPSAVEIGGTTYRVGAIGDYAFYGCTGLTTVEIGEGIEVLRASALRNCTGLTQVKLPQTLDSIMENVFLGCSSLVDVVFRGGVPPWCHQTAFSGLDLNGMRIGVPCGADSVYAAVELWGMFGTMNAGGCEVVITAVANHAERGRVDGGGIFAEGEEVVLQGVAADGYFFVCWNDGDTTNPRRMEALESSAYVAFFFPYRHDTVERSVYVRDTVIAEPTMHTLSVQSANEQRGWAVGTCTVPEGTSIEIAALPQEGCRFAGWSDGETDNPRTVVVNTDMVITAQFEDRARIGQAEQPWWTLTTEGRSITVYCEKGRMLRVYDVEGRLCVATRTVSEKTTLSLQEGGIYMVNIEGGSARKIYISER